MHQTVKGIFCTVRTVWSTAAAYYSYSVIFLLSVESSQMLLAALRWQLSFPEPQRFALVY